MEHQISPSPKSSFVWVRFHRKTIHFASEMKQKIRFKLLTLSYGAREFADHASEAWKLKC